MALSVWISRLGLGVCSGMVGCLPHLDLTLGLLGLLGLGDVAYKRLGGCLGILCWC